MQIETNKMGSNLEIAGVNGNSLFFNIWVTTSCNYACSYCYEGAQKKNIFMDAATASSLIRFVTNMAEKMGENNVKINFHGGEPTLNIPIIKYVINQFKEKTSLEIYTSMTTNCSVFSAEIVCLLDELTLSIDGNKNTHDRNRKLKNNTGTFDCSFRNALLYLKSHFNTKVNMVITAHTVNEVYDNIMFLINNGFKNIVPHVDYFDTEWDEVSFDILYGQLIKIKNAISGQGLKDVQIGLLNLLIRKKGRCVVGTYHFQIYPDGNIYPCSVVAGIPKYCIGNVNEGLDELKVKQLNFLMNPVVSECSACKYYNYCETCRCYFVNEALTGNMYTPSGVVCAMEHLKIRLMKDG